VEDPMEPKDVSLVSIPDGKSGPFRHGNYIAAGGAEDVSIPDGKSAPFRP